MSMPDRSFVENSKKAGRRNETYLGAENEQTLCNVRIDNGCDPCYYWVVERQGSAGFRVQDLSGVVHPPQELVVNLP